MKNLYVILAALTLMACNGGSPPPNAPKPPEPPPPVCEAFLSWTAPSERVDGTALNINELSKFTIYISWASGQQPEDIVAVVDIPDNYLVEWSISRNDPGTHWYYMTATDLDEQESAFSNEVNKECP